MFLQCTASIRTPKDSEFVTKAYHQNIPVWDYRKDTILGCVPFVAEVGGYWCARRELRRASDSPGKDFRAVVSARRYTGVSLNDRIKLKCLRKLHRLHPDTRCGGSRALGGNLRPKTWQASCSIMHPSTHPDGTGPNGAVQTLVSLRSAGQVPTSGPPR